MSNGRSCTSKHSARWPPCRLTRGRNGWRSTGSGAKPTRSISKAVLPRPSPCSRRRSMCAADCWVTNIRSPRPGAALLPGPTYDEYAERGESENRHKEFRCDLSMDRLSDHRFVANYFRLYLPAAAMNLLVRLRRFIAEPLPASAPQAETASPTTQPGEAACPA